jgi:type II secretory pathway component GspD/PulD (secretin)
MPNIFKKAKEQKKSNLNEEKNEKIENFFMRKGEKGEKEEVFVFEEENFPSLGDSNKKEDVTKSFSAALNHEQQNKKKEKDKWAGWITIKKDGTVIQHEDSGRYQRVRAMLDELDEERRQIRFEKRIYELEQQKELEYYLNGPEYIDSWEVNSYLAQREKELIKNEEQSDCSDDEDFSD